jgi:hypothetical protein
MARGSQRQRGCWSKSPPQMLVMTNARSAKLEMACQQCHVSERYKRKLCTWCTYGVANADARRRSVLGAALAWSKFEARERVVNLSCILVRVDVADQREKDDESDEVTHGG